MRRAEVAAAYDARAAEYVEKLGSIEQMASLDRATITLWARRTRGRILDAGCGPGHWSEALSAGGRCDVIGVDASARFVQSARGRFPHIDFLVGDLVALPLPNDSVDGILAWFSIIHSAPADVPAILRELARVLVPGGSLLLGFFDGEAGAPFDHAVTTAYHWSTESLGELLESHGFFIERATTRQDAGVRRQGDILARLAPSSRAAVDR